MKRRHLRQNFKTKDVSESENASKQTEHEDKEDARARLPPKVDQPDVRARMQQEKPTEEVIPKTNPIREFSSVLPKAIIIMPIVAIKIDIQTLNEICSFRKINAKSA